MWIITVQNKDGIEYTVKAEGTFNEVRNKAELLCKEGDIYFIDIYL